MNLNIKKGLHDIIEYSQFKRIRVKSASGQVGLSQLGRVNSAGSSRPYIYDIVVYWLIEKDVPNENTSL